MPALAQMPQLTPEQLANTPSAQPPPGVTPNFVNPPTRAPMGEGVVALALILMLAAASARFYTRGFIIKNWGWDDLFCIFAVIFTICYDSLGFAFFRSGSIAVHPWDIPLSKLMDDYFYQLFVANLAIYAATFFSIKMTILMLISRVFGVRPWVRYSCYVVMTIVSLFYFITLVLSMVWCAPKAGESVLLTVTSKVCQVDAQRISTGQAAFSVITDVFLLAIPIPLVLKLNISNRKKLGLVLVFGLGIIATAMSILTLYYRATYSTDTWSATVNVEIASVYECNVGVIVACLPCIPAIARSPLVQSWMEAGSGGWTRLVSISKRLTSSQASRSRGSELKSSHDNEQNGSFGSDRSQNHDLNRFKEGSLESYGSRGNVAELKPWNPNTTQ